MIQLTVAPEISTKLNTTHGYQACADSIFQCIYTPEKAKSISLYLKGIYQNAYYLIDSYYTDIRCTVNALAIIQKWGKAETARRIEVEFYRGLNQPTELKMFEIGKTTVQSIIEYIRGTEEILTRNLGACLKETEKKEYVQQQAKYCSKCRTPTHNTKDCWSKTTTGNRQRSFDKGKDKTYVIKPSSPEQKEITIRTSIKKGISVDAVLDSGSTLNFINPKIFEDSVLEEEKITPTNVTFGNGESRKIDRKAIIELFLPAFNYNHKTTVYILKDLPTSLILGLSFFREVKCCIDFTNECITINNIRQDLNLIKEPNDLLIDKASILMNQTEATKNKFIRMINERVMESEGKNPLLGKMSFIQHQVVLNKPRPELYRKAYPIPFGLYEEVKSEIKRLKENKIIRDSTSNFVSPAFVARKKSGDLRLLMDYKKANDYFVTETFPCPSLNDCLQRLKGTIIFSQLDLSKGYYQIPMDKGSIPYTSFILPFGQYEFLRMPFGLKNGPRTFQRAMMMLFRECDFVNVYLDDLLIASKTFKDHYEHVNKVLTILETENISINFKKSSFCKNKVNYLGHEISADGVKADLSRIDKLETLKAPTTKKQILKLIGLLNWYRPYIKNLSTKISKISDKTRQDEQFSWSDEDNAIIKAITADIKENIILSFPDYKRPFELYCDASNVGCGAILKQDKNLIGIYSNKFTGPQLNYHTQEKEFLGILKGYEYFKNIVYCSKTIVYTDSKNMTMKPWKAQSELTNGNFF